jgi:deoxyribodipyrimidine photolyase-related protein
VNHVFVLGDQLTAQVGPLSRLEPARTNVLMVESVARGRQHPYHKQKLALLYSAMRHFRLELEGQGFRVSYQQAETFSDGIQAYLKEHPGAQLTLMQPAEHGVGAALADIIKQYGGGLNIVPNELWLSSEADWEAFAHGRKSLRMEFFYRQMRQKTGWLMDGNNPVGGAWNFDADNRQVPERDHVFPPRFQLVPDALTLETMTWVEQTFPDHFGRLEGFNWPVSRDQALAALEHFLHHRLAAFGPFEDAMVEGETQLYHSLLSPAINLGLLTPKEVCERALLFANDPGNHVPISSLEGFVRQILGWREFMYHVYRSKMPALRLENRLNHTRPLPGFYWTGQTRMRCVSSAVQQLIHTGHTHHIQRLMVLGNFALIAGVRPQELNDWFLMGYVDAFDWVVTPNVLGMSQFADLGSFTSKPYASGAGYIQRMSDHCGSCAYNPKQTRGPQACPFASLYWDFVDRHLETFASNPRMGVVVNAWKKRDSGEKRATLEQASSVLKRLDDGVL